MAPRVLNSMPHDVEVELEKLGLTGAVKSVSVFRGADGAPSRSLLSLQDKGSNALSRLPVLNCISLGCLPGDSHPDCPDCKDGALQIMPFKKAFPPSSLSVATLGSRDYMSIVKQPSYPVDPRTRAPALVILSLEEVVCAAFKPEAPHLSDGYTDYLRRTYLETLIEYLLAKPTKACMAVWTGSKNRKEAMKCLHELSMPTGGPEADERDGVMGVWTKEDTTPSQGGLGIGLKDLEVIWKELAQEEGMFWSAKDTVVITANGAYMASQPFNYIAAPAYHYKMERPSSEDQFLFMMISCIEELLQQSNFASYIREQGWNDASMWTSTQPAKVAIQDSHCHDALKICASRNITIKASGSNQRKP